MDFENDGDLDIYQTNGWTSFNEFGGFPSDTTRAFVADGSGRFQDQAAARGLDDTHQGRGVICADLDNDGDIDILQLHAEPRVAATLWRNDSDKNAYLSVKLNGLPPNTEALGARITVTIGSVKQLREVISGSNFASQNPTRQLFGLGLEAQVDQLDIEWPDGKQTVMRDVPANQTLTINHPDR